MARGFAQVLRPPWGRFKRALGNGRYHRGVIPERFVPEPSEVVIWGASSLLSLVVGLGVAFFLWMALHRSGQPVVADSAVVSLGVGLALIGLSAERPLPRLFFVLLAAMMVVAYALGGPEFARLFPP